MKTAKKTTHLTEVGAGGEGLGEKYGKSKGRGVNIIEIDPFFQATIVNNLVGIGTENEIEIDLKNKTKEDIEKFAIELGGNKEEIKLFEGEEKKSISLVIKDEITDNCAALLGKDCKNTELVFKSAIHLPLYKNI